MARAADFQGDILVKGSVIATSLPVPSGTITNSMVAGSADIDATKLEHQHSLTYSQVTGTAVVSETKDVMIVRGATGTLVQMEACITGAIATGADRTVTVDLHKSTGAGAFATVLSSTIVFSNTDALRTLEQAAFSSTALVDGDILRVVVTVAGAAGAQAQGLVVTLTVREDAT